MGKVIRITDATHERLRNIWAHYHTDGTWPRTEEELIRFCANQTETGIIGFTMVTEEPGLLNVATNQWT